MAERGRPRSFDRSAALARAIEAAPNAYWLVPIRTGQLAASVLHRVS